MQQTCIFARQYKIYSNFFLNLLKLTISLTQNYVAVPHYSMNTGEIIFFAAVGKCRLRFFTPVVPCPLVPESCCRRWYQCRTNASIYLLPVSAVGWSYQAD